MKKEASFWFLRSQATSTNFFLSRMQPFQRCFIINRKMMFWMAKTTLSRILHSYCLSCQCQSIMINIINCSFQLTFSLQCGILLETGPPCKRRDSQVSEQSCLGIKRLTFPTSFCPLAGLKALPLR